MYRIVVTGATSMIGTALVKECIKRNVEVLAIVKKKSVRLNRLPTSEMLEIIACDLHQLGSIEKKERQTYDVFYHFAWAHTSKETRDDPLLQEENIRCTLEAVKLAHKLGCRKFIGAGSQAEYGATAHVICPETAVNPHISYGIAKYAAGMLSRKLCVQYGMVHIWGRIFSVYGKNDSEGTMINYAVDQFLKGQPASFSSAVQMWDYLYEDDAGRIFYLLGKCIEENKVYCIANGNSRPLKQFIMEMQEVYGAEAECTFADEHNETAAGIQPDPGSLQNDIAYRPETSFKEGIARVIAYRKQLRRENKT